jgi:hypothetical protein
MEIDHALCHSDSQDRSFVVVLQSDANICCLYAVVVNKGIFLRIIPNLSLKV